MTKILLRRIKVKIKKLQKYLKNVATVLTLLGLPIV
jgi:hypothetical protein